MPAAFKSTRNISAVFSGRSNTVPSGARVARNGLRRFASESATGCSARRPFFV
jgi:hypothetical protein